LLPSEHDCHWKRTAAALKEELLAQRVAFDAQLADKHEQIRLLLARVHALEHKIALAEKQIIGPKSERMPTPDEEAKKREPKKERGGYQNPRKRRENKEAMASLPATIVTHPIPAEERRCPHCGEDVRPIGSGDRSTEYEWIPGYFARRIHVVETGRCPCKMHYARGPAPDRVQEGCKYGPAFLAKLAVDKCADATPLYRVEKQMRRAGVPISRSTMNDLVLLAAQTLAPLWWAALAEVRRDPHLQADETSFRTQTSPDRSFVWTFLSAILTVYVFSPSRSGDTPNGILAGTIGSLTCDGYTGYNHVTEVLGRDRTGCWSHARRYLFDALPSAPDARDGLDIILDLFMVERLAANRGILGSPEHQALRNARSVPVLNRMLIWMKDTFPKYEPKSAMGIALRYIKNQWPRLIAFADDPQVPIHNNASEAALRIVALLRKNSLFFGNDDAGRGYMVLLTLIATCEKHDVNPEVYLTDVLLRIQRHPKNRLHELLPHRWKIAHGSGFKVQIVETPNEAA
jgi:transposase